nr:reverse transcriptase domain-containing protein [Tanacetum cinerariifolium]
MRTRSSSNLLVVSLSNSSTSNPKRRNRRCSKQPFILEESTVGAARWWLEKEPPRSIHTWEDLAWDRYKDLLRAFPHHGFTELHQLDTFCNALNPTNQNSLNAAVGGNLLQIRTQDVLTIIKNKSKVRNSRNKSIVSQVKSCDANSNSSSEIAKLTHAVNQQTSAVTTAMTVILKQFQATPPLAFVKAVEEVCVTCSGAHPYYQCLAVSGNTFPELRDNIHGYVPIPPTITNPEEDERVEETLTDPDLAEYTIKVPHPPKMLKALLSNKEKLQELANTPQNENCSAVILKKLPKKLGDPGKFLIPCGFSELKCKALTDLGASINLRPLSVWKKLGLPKLIPTRMTLKVANRAICTPAGIARDVFIPVGKFTCPADFIIVDYESDPRVPLILGRPFLRTTRALIDVHGEEMILCDGDERLTLNMRHDTFSYSNQPQKESINLINVFNNPSEDFLEDLFPYQPSGNPTFSLHPELTSSEVNCDIFDSEGCNVLSEKLLDLDSTKDLHPPLHDNQLSGSFTYPLLEEFADELPSEYDDNLQFDIESYLKEIEFCFTKIKILVSRIRLIKRIDFSKVDALPSTHNEDKIFNQGILIQEKPIEIITRVVQDKKLAISNASLVFEDFDPPFYEPLFFKEVPKSKMLLLFLSENEEKVSKLGIHTSEKVHSYFSPELSHQGYKVFKINQIFKSLMKNFLFYYGKDTHILAVPHHHFYPLDQFKYGGIGSSSVT